MFWWLKTVFAASALIYLFTLLLGLVGNSWVIASVIRTAKKARASVAGSSSISSSDRLRKYIWLLALLDLFVSGSLSFRVWNLLFPEQTISDSTCQFMFSMDQLAKLCSLTCLACISIERFITIRKPFNSKVRRLAVQMTPLFALFSVGLCGAAILWLSCYSVRSSEDGLNCSQRDSHSLGSRLANWTLAVGFCVQLTVVTVNYARIVHHVRRKFWQRKARAVANSFSERSESRVCCQSLSADSSRNSNGTARLVKKQSPPLLVVSEPRYMREMTTAIVRIAVFHLFCWLPFCLLQVLPVLQCAIPQLDIDSLKMRSSIAVRIVDSTEHGLSAWAAFGANWLTYANSAGNWVLYAALNRDLRSIIKASSERRRKRSTMSHQPHSPSASSNLLRRSARRKAFQSLRLFYSLNSHRSSASVENENNSAVTTTAVPVSGHAGVHAQQSNNSSLRAPSGSECGGMRKPSARSAEEEEKNAKRTNDKGREQCAGLGLFGWRDGRAYTYCAPRAAFGDIAQQSNGKNGALPNAHLRMAKQIIATVYNGRNCREESKQRTPNAGGNGYKPKRKESAAERRELYAAKQSALPPIVISFGASDEGNIC